MIVECRFYLYLLFYHGWLGYQTIVSSRGIRATKSAARKKALMADQKHQVTLSTPPGD